MIRVLIVDDCQLDRERVRRALTKSSSFSCEFLEASNAAEGLETYRTTQPDVMFLDYRLPDMDGLEFLRELNGDEAVGVLPIIMLTGDSSETVAIDAMKLGALDYLNKGELVSDSIRMSTTHVIQRMQAIREGKESRLQLERAIDRARASSESKSQFLANMSHEIRTPMTAIVGFAENLLEYDLTEEESDLALKTIVDNGRYLLGLINDILDLSKVEANRIELELIEFSPRALLEEIQTLISPRAEARGLTLNVQSANNLPTVIESDPTRIRQILINLLSNAIKFSTEGEILLLVHFERIGDNEGNIVCSVADSGIGITEEQLTRLFQPFSQADGSTTRKYGGTGLGLSISKRLADLLGGDLAVRSQANRGSVFRLMVPTKTGAGAEYVDWEHFGPTEITTEPTTSHLPALNARVLIAEDVDANQRLIRFILEKAGATVTVVDNGRAAVDAFTAAEESQEPFDLVLMDTQMPIMDGHEAARLLRDHNSSVPIIALTANAMDVDQRRCIVAGCNVVITKPIDRHRLLRTLVEALETDFDAPIGLPQTDLG